MGAFLESRGYKLHSDHPEHRRYQKDNVTFVGLDTYSPNCVSFVSYVRSDSSDFVAARAISEKFLGHFGKKWSTARGHVCSAP